MMNKKTSIVLSVVVCTVLVGITGFNLWKMRKDVERYFGIEK